MSGALQCSPWAREKRRNALVAAIHSIPFEEARAVLTGAICEVYGAKRAMEIAANLPDDIAEAIEEGAADASAHP